MPARIAGAGDVAKKVKGYVSHIAPCAKMDVPNSGAARSTNWRNSAEVSGPARAGD